VVLSHEFGPLDTKAQVESSNLQLPEVLILRSKLFIQSSNFCEFNQFSRMSKCKEAMLKLKYRGNDTNKEAFMTSQRLLGSPLA
jgi:hypothetical protein